MNQRRAALFLAVVVLAVVAVVVVSEGQQLDTKQQDTKQEGVPPQGATTPSGQGAAQEPSVLLRFQPWMVMLLVLATLAAMMGSLWMIYLYINNIRTTEFHRQILFDAVTEYRYRKILESTSYEGPDHSYSGSGFRSDETPDERARREKEERDREIQADQARKQFREKSLQTARIEANQLVPPSLSVAGMGITGAFFIELTAILTIIFGILILGLVGVLGTREIAPILAAIAGYVLGKTTSAQAQAPQASRPGLQQPSPQSQGEETPALPAAKESR